jgi:CheY-like chemotaxis protein
MRIDTVSCESAMKKILFIDDEALILEIYRTKLQQYGFRVDTATDGLEALRMMRSSRPDVVVLDIMMPKFSGLEVLKYIRAEPALKDLRVVVLSNMFVGAEERQAATAGADKALLKSGCTPALLVEAINEVMAAPRADDRAPGPSGAPGGTAQR